MHSILLFFPYFVSFLALISFLNHINGLNECSVWGCSLIGKDLRMNGVLYGKNGTMVINYAVVIRK
ncbi:MAG TPA: hypothetical protein DSN98_03645 [Thermoplasmata archaeon]|nr:MAG TPA: hypothetical protein DSN98_03645 [Thermoplasmata archaeon]